MNFLNKLTDTASKTYKFTADKTTKIAKISKLKALMNEDKQKVEDLYTEIGKEVYENHIREEKTDLSSKLEDICIEIDAYCNQIEMTRIEILKLKDLKKCVNCSFEMELEYEYCPKCGKNQQEESQNLDNYEEK